ncbi:hypothetical protein [Aquibacillus saliphilus]|uniref:hypothetical protein n=1 Tax=Aquibacillus saliphilus TaxID=1909422 RepID=UPI001CEFF33F|nr:hypothetical protein [Aquibacillus saliphilus]
MTNAFLSPNQLITFHQEKVNRTTALNYSEEMEKAKTPFITVEKKLDNNYNIIGGFKYINGLRLLGKTFPLYCTIVNSFKSEKARKIAMLQRCLASNEKNIYKELLVYELTHDFGMNENLISVELGYDAKKIKRYMYFQVIPENYLERAKIFNAKHLVQAIYLANSFTSTEKRLLTELSLQEEENLRFKGKHLSLYKLYRRKYPLYEDFAMAKNQIQQAIRLDSATDEYWKGIPHPLNYQTDNTLDIETFVN